MRKSELPRLSKSRFTRGLQCPKLLWWTVHEPDAIELVPDAAQQRAFARGNQVGELARSYVPGGVLIDPPHHRPQERIAATVEALSRGARVIYEASFSADGVYVSVDILERRGSGFVLIEVKSTLDVKEQHLADVAIQLHVVRRCGLAVTRAEVMHLNRECRYPDLSKLFVRAPVTAKLRALLRDAPLEASALRRMLAGPIPAIAVGAHCRDPYECPFLERCWPPLPDHHVSTLYRIPAARVEELLAAGYVTLHDLPHTAVRSRIARRQLRSVQGDELVVERGLRRALSAFRAPLAYLDFETINPAIPVWPGCAPYDQIPVQFSGQVRERDGGLVSHGWIAEGSGDPRRPLAEKLLAACSGARTIVAYNAPFERRCIDGLATALPDLATELGGVAGRLVDLLPVVREHVYHPDFAGSFGLKSVLPALVAGLRYDDLEIRDGEAASELLEVMLLDPGLWSESERSAWRDALLRYCERDTLAMVRLHERLIALASGG